MTAMTHRPCPRCGATDALEIAYGLPGVGLWESSQRGEIALGGCIIEPEAPDYACRSCRAPLPWLRPRDDDDLDVG